MKKDKMHAHRFFCSSVSCQVPFLSFDCLTHTTSFTHSNLSLKITECLTGFSSRNLSSSFVSSCIAVQASSCPLVPFACLPSLCSQTELSLQSSSPHGCSNQPVCDDLRYNFSLNHSTTSPVSPMTFPFLWQTQQTRHPCQLIVPHAQHRHHLSPPLRVIGFPGVCPTILRVYFPVEAPFGLCLSSL